MKNLEDIRDTGGLNILSDIPVGETVNFYGTPLKVGSSDENVAHSKLPCAGCYFLWHEINSKEYDQCACLKYCTSANRADHQSVFFFIPERRKNK